MKRPALCVLFFALCIVTAAAQQPPDKYFHFDMADAQVSAYMMLEPRDYQPDIAIHGQDEWIAWLEFVPDKGDRIWLGRRNKGNWLSREKVLSDAGEYANPTVTLDAKGGVWVTYEARVEGNWDIFAVRRSEEGGFGEILPVTRVPGPDINHRTAPDPEEGLWVTWQSGRESQFDIVARHVTNAAGEIHAVSMSEFSDWHPDIAALKDGTVVVVWDAYDGESYNVHARVLQGESWGSVIDVAATPAFEGHAQVAAGPDGAWIIWEEGALNWGKHYLTKRNVRSQGSQEISDDCGPLHRFRSLHMVRVDMEGKLHTLKTPLPMPSRDAAAKRETHKKLGSYYEGARLTVDAAGRPWVAYRQRYLPWLGFDPWHHVEEGWGVFARCLTADGWSPLQRFSINQGDRLQRIEISPWGNGIAAAYETGRTDRRWNDRERGIAAGYVRLPGPPPGAKQDEAGSKPGKTRGPVAEPPAPVTFKDEGKTYSLLLGDMHRHTEFSLCFVPTDGTLVDQYRYAIDVAPLDFLAITDHTRDIAMGDVLSLIWWRCRKEVSRHALAPRFISLYGFERSRGMADHNVISLNGTMLRPHTYEHHVFWKEFDEDTLTIPHQYLDARNWVHRNDKARPLFEVYQGFRDRSIEDKAHDAFNTGHHMGIIASSDHLSTGASYAGVWAEEREHVSLFRAMQNRRTFGATARMQLVMMVGDKWMGEIVPANEAKLLKVDVRGTAPIEAVEVWIDGEMSKEIRAEKNGGQFRTAHALPVMEGIHYLYVKVKQTDGNRAWSSPVWTR